MGICEEVRAQHNSITPKKTQIITNQVFCPPAFGQARDWTGSEEKQKGNTGQQSRSDVFVETKTGQILCLPHKIHINMPSL